MKDTMLKNPTMKLYEMHEYTEEYTESDCRRVYTEDDIIQEFWPYWYDKMVAKYGEGHELITREKCIEDWVAVNWAVEVGSVDE